jgi:hypothetical protein
MQITVDYGLVKHDAMWFGTQASRFGRIACFHHQRGILSSTEKKPFKLGVTEMKTGPEAASEKAQNGGVRNCHKRRRISKLQC